MFSDYLEHGAGDRQIDILIDIFKARPQALNVFMQACKRNNLTLPVELYTELYPGVGRANVSGSGGFNKHCRSYSPNTRSSSPRLFSSSSDKTDDKAQSPPKKRKSSGSSITR